MTAFSITSARPTFLGRCTAWSSVALVVLLAWLSVDPAAHAWLHAQEHAGAVADTGHACAHGHEHGHAPAHGDGHDSFPLPSGDEEDANCVVLKFAQGHVDVALAPVGIFGALSVADAAITPAIVASVEQAEYRLPPGRGPPAV